MQAVKVSLNKIVKFFPSLHAIENIELRHIDFRVWEVTLFVIGISYNFAEIPQ